MNEEIQLHCLLLFVGCCTKLTLHKTKQTNHRYFEYFCVFEERILNEQSNKIKLILE